MKKWKYRVPEKDLDVKTKQEKSGLEKDFERKTTLQM